MNVLVEIEPKAGVLNLLLCHGSLWESGKSSSHKNVFKYTN